MTIAQLRKHSAILLLCLFAHAVPSRAQTYSVDVYTGSGEFTFDQNLWLDLSTLAGQGIKLWFVADLNGNGVATNNVLPTGVISGDNKLILETFLDIGVNAAADGNFTAFGLQVLNQYSNAHIYVYLWNTTNSAEHGGDMFGIMDLGVHPPPTFGNPLWLISNAVYATQFTLMSYQTNIWATNNSGYWSDTANWFTNPASAPGSSTNYLLFGSTSAYRSTNDIGDFTLSLLEFTGSGDATLSSSNGSGYKLIFTNEFGKPAIWQNSSGLTVIESDINLASDTSIDGNGTGALFVAGVVSGPGGITKDGTSTLILSNANTFSGTVTLNSGAILIGNDLSIGTNSLFLNGGLLASANSSARTFSNQTAIAASMAFGQNSGGTGDLTFLGPVTLSNGVWTLTISNNLTVFAGVVSSGGIIKSGTGTLLLSNNNTFSGGIRIDDGILKVGNNGALNTNVIEMVSGTLRLDGRSPVVGGIYSTNPFAVVDNGAAGASTLTVNVVTGNDFTFPGTVINGGAGALGVIKDGGGDWTLVGTNTYSGGTTIRAGRLVTVNTNGLGTGAVTLNGGALVLHYDSDATFGPTGYNVTLNSNATIEIDNTLGDNSVTFHTLTLGSVAIGTNTLTLAGSNSYTLAVRSPIALSNSTINALGGKLYFPSNATFAATNTFGGDSRITFGGATNSFSNNATIVSTTAGGLAVSNILLFSGNTTVSNTDAVIFDGRITNLSAVPAQLTKAGPGRLFMTNFADTNLLKNALSNLTINGGQLRIAATASMPNSLGTNTTITMNGGALEIRSDSTLTFGTNSGYFVTLNSNATLDVGYLTNSAGARTITIGGINSLTNKTLTVSGNDFYTLLVSTAVALSNTTINVSSFNVTNLYRGLSNNNNFSGDATLTGNGRIAFLGTNVLSNGVTIHASSSGGVLFSNIVLGGTNTFDAGLPLIVSGIVTQSVAGSHLIKTGASTMTIGTNGANTNNFFTGGTEIQAGTLSVVGRPSFWLPLGTNGVTLGNATFGLLGTNSMTFGTNGGYNLLVTNDAMINVDQALTGFTGATLSLGTLTNGGNTIIISGANSFRLGFNGVVGLSNSTLFVDTGSLLLAGPSNVFAGAITFSGTNVATILSNVVNGATAASIVRTGGGTLALISSNSFTGGVTISSGVVQISNNAALGPGVLTFAGGTLASASATAFTVTNVVLMPGDAGFGQSAGGTGDLTLTGPVDLTNGSRTLTVNNNNTTLSGIISNGAIVKLGTGTLIIPATNYANTYADGTDIKAGNVRLIGATGFQTGLGTNTITLGGGTLQLRADSDLIFGPGLGYTVTLTNNSTIDVGRIGTDGGTGKYLSIATLNLDVNALTVLGASNYVLLINSNIIADTYTLDMGGISTLSNAIVRFSGATSGIVQFNGSINAFDSLSTNIFTGGATIRLPGLTTISNAVVAATNTRVEFGTNTTAFNFIGNNTFTGTNGVFTLFGSVLISNQTTTATNNTGGTSTSVLFGNNVLVESNAAFFGGGNYTFAGPTVLTNTIITAAVSRVTFLTNTYLSGPTNILGGTLNATSFQFNGPSAFSSNGALRVTGTGAVNFASVDFSGRLLFDATANGTVTVNGALNDTNVGGSVVKAGINTLILAASNNYAGGTIVTNTGILELRHTNAAGSGTITLTTGSILNLRSNVSATFGPLNEGYDILALGTTGTLSSGPVGSGSNNVLAIGTLYLGAGVNLTNNTTSNYFTAVNGPVTMASNATITANGNLVLNDVILTTNRQLLTKAGAGILFFNTNRAPTVLLSNTGGAFQWNYTLADANPTNAGFDTNSILLNGGAFRWAPTNALAANQSATLTNPFLVLSGGGQLLAAQRTTAGLAPNVIFTGTITNQGTLLIGSFDAGETNAALNIQYNGTLLVDQITLSAPAPANSTATTIGTTRGLTYVKAINSPLLYDADYNGNIVDGGTNILFRNPLALNGGSNFFGTLNLNGTANTYAGGTIVNGINNGGIINIAAGSSLGLGDVTINPGGRLRLNSLANVAAGHTVFVQAGGVLGVGTGIDPTSLVDGGSTGVIAIDTTSYSVSLNLAAIGSGRMILGSTITNGVYQSASLGAGSDGIYRLGGGGGTLTLTNTANLLTGTNSVVLGAYSNRVAVGNLMTDAVYNATLKSTLFSTNGSGVIVLGQANNYSGTTVVNSGTNVAAAAGALGTNSILINGGTLIIAATNAYVGTNGIPVVPAGGQLVTLVNGDAKPFGNTNVMTHAYGTLAASGSQGTFLNATNFFIHPGGILALDSFTTGLNTNRLNDTNSLLLNGGTLLFAGQAANGSVTTETNGVLTVRGGSAIQLQGVTNTTASTILTLSNIVRLSNGTVRLSPSSTGAFDLGTSNRIFVSNAPANVSNMVAPWIVNTSSNTFLFYSNTVGFTNAIYATTNLVSAASNLVVNAANPIPQLGTNKDVYALRLAGNIGSLTNTITNRSGGLIFAASAAIGPRLVFQSNATPMEALIFVGTGVTGTITNSITAASITKFGLGTLQMTTTSNNAYASGWDINEGTVLLNNSNGLGQGLVGNFVNLNGGATLIFSNATAYSNTLFTSGKISLLDYGNTLRLASGIADATNTIANVDLNSLVPGQGSTATLVVGNSRNQFTIPTLTLNDNATLVLSNAQVASGSLGSIGVTNLAATNKTLTLLGAAQLYLLGDNRASFVSNNVFVSGGSLAFTTTNAFGTNSVFTIGPDAALDLRSAVSNYTGGSSQVRQLAGSAERWSHLYSRFADAASFQTITLSNGVNLQLNTDLIGLTNKTINLTGGVLEPFVYSDSAPSGFVRTNGAGVTLNLSSDSFVGRSTADPSISNVLNLAIEGLITGTGRLTKIGANTVIIRTAESNNTFSGGTDLKGGILQVELRTNAAGGVTTTNPLGAGLITLGGGQLNLLIDTNAATGFSTVVLGNSVVVTNMSGLDVSRLGAATLPNLFVTLGGLTNLGQELTLSAGATTNSLAFSGPTLLSNATLNMTRNNSTQYFNGTFTLLGTSVFTGDKGRTVVGGVATFGNNAAIYSTLISNVDLNGGVSFSGTNLLRATGGYNISGALNEATGGSSFIKDGPGALNITNNVASATPFSGGFTVLAGAVNAVAASGALNSPLGTGTITLGGGSLTLRADTSVNFGGGQNLVLTTNVSLAVNQITSAGGFSNVLSVGNVSMGNNAVTGLNNVLTLTSTSNYIFGINGTLNGFAGFTSYDSTTNFAGTGIVQFNAAQLFTNANFFGSGLTFRFNNTNDFGSNTVLLVTNTGGLVFLNSNYVHGPFTVSNTTPVIFNGALLDGSPGQLIKTGTGVVFLTNLVDGTYAGGTVINQGFIRASGLTNGVTTVTNPLGTGPVTLAGGGLALLADTNLTFGPSGGYAISVTGPASITVDRNLTNNFPTNNVITIGSLNVPGGALTITNLNGYLLAVNASSIWSNSTFSAGILQYNNSVAINDTNFFGNFTNRALGGYYLNGVTAGGVTNGVAVFSNSGNLVLNGLIRNAEDGTAGRLVKTGPGTLFLTNMINHTFDGGAAVGGGILQVAFGTNTNTSVFIGTPLGTNGTIALNGGMLDIRLTDSVSNQTMIFGTNLAAASGYVFNATNGGINVDRIAGSAGLTNTIQIGQLNLGGPLFVNGGNSFRLQVTNALALDGNSINVSNVVLVFTNTVTAQNTNFLGGVGPGAISNFNLLLNGANTLFVTNTNVLQGLITGAGAGGGSLVKDGPGTLVIGRSNNLISNSFTGGTIIVGGTLQLEQTNAVGTNRIALLGIAGAPGQAGQPTLALRNDSTTLYGGAAGYSVFASSNITLNAQRFAANNTEQRIGSLTLSNNTVVTVTTDGNNDFGVFGTTSLGGSTLFRVTAGGRTLLLDGPLIDTTGGLSSIFGKDGTNALVYTNATLPNFGGGAYVNEGALIWRPTGALSNTIHRFGTGTVTLDGGSRSVFGLQAATNNLIYTNANNIVVRGALAQGNGIVNWTGGQIDATPSGTTTPRVVYSGLVDVAGPLWLAGGGTQGYGTANFPMDIQGQVLLDGGDRTIYVNNSGNAGSRLVISGTLTNDGVTRNLNFVLNSNATLELRGTNLNNITVADAYTGVNGRLRLYNANPIGAASTGTITVNQGNFLGIGFNPGTLANGFATLTNKITFAVNSILGLDASAFTNNISIPINLSTNGVNGLGRDVFLGVSEGFTFTNHPATNLITPYAATYKLGGGGGTLILNANTNLTDFGTTNRSLVVNPSPYLSAVGVGNPMTLTVNGTNTFSGGTIVNAGQVNMQNSNTLSTGAIDLYGTLNVTGANGRLNAVGDFGTNANAITTHPNSQVVLDGATGAPIDRFGDVSSLNLNAATLRLNGSNGPFFQYTEAMSNVNFVGASTINLQNINNAASNSVTLLVSNLTRVGNATLGFTMSASTTNLLGASNRLVIANTATGLPAVSNGMVAPYFINTLSNTFLNYAAGSGFTNAAFTTINLTNATAADIVDVTSGTNISGLITNFGMRIGAFILTNTLPNPSYITVAGGGVLSTGNATNNAGLVFSNLNGLVEGVFYNVSGTTLTLNSNVVASTITKFGTGTLLLQGSGSSTYTNGWNINQGTLNANTAFALGNISNNAANVVNLNGGANLFFGATANYSGGRIVSYDTNTITPQLGADANFGMYTNGLDLTSYGNGSLGSVLEINNTRNRVTFNIAGQTRLLVSNIVFNAKVSTTGVTVNGSGYSDRFVLAGGVVGTNNLITKYGIGNLTFGTNTAGTFSNATINVLGGVLGAGSSVGFSNYNSVFGTNSVVNFSPGTVLEIQAGVTNFTPAAGGTLINQAGGSAERWLGQTARFNLTAAPETNIMAPGVNLQIVSNLVLLVNKTIFLSGASIEAWAPADSLSISSFTDTVGSGVTIALGTNSSVGQSGVDVGQRNGVLVLNGVITDNGGGFSLNKIGPDTVVLGNTNAYIGNTLISGGTLRVGTNNAIPLLSYVQFTNSNNGLLDLNAFNQQVAGVSGTNGAVITNSQAGNSVFTVSGTSNSSYFGTIAGNVSLTKDGTSSLTLGGTNTYTGTSAVLGGTVVLAGNALDGQPGTLGNSTSAVLLGNTSGSTDAALLVNSGLTVGRAITVQSGSTGTATLGGTFTSGTGSFTNIVTLNKDAILTAGTGGTVNFSGAIGGPGGITKTGGGTVNLNAANGYGGNTIVSAGRLQNGIDNALPAATYLNVTNTGAYNLNGFNQTVAALAGNGQITNTGASRTLTVSGATSTEFTGNVRGALGLTKAGGSTLKLSGNNDFSGATLVGGGTLELGAAGALAGTSGITITNGGTLLLSGAAGGRINDSASMTLGGGTFHTGGLSETLGTLTLSANSTIDLGSGASLLAFANSFSLSSVWANGGGTLVVTNWSGQWNIGGGTDQLIFGSTSSGLDAGQVSQIKFQFGTELWNAQILNSGEVIPVPEPATWLATASVLGLLGFRERRRISWAIRRLSLRS